MLAFGEHFVFLEKLPLVSLSLDRIQDCLSGISCTAIHSVSFVKSITYEVLSIFNIIPVVFFLSLLYTVWTLTTSAFYSLSTISLIFFLLLQLSLFHYTIFNLLKYSSLFPQ